MVEEGKSHLEMVRELDEMDRDVTSTEADFLDKSLKALEAGNALRPADAVRLETIHRKYLGNDDEGRARAGADDESEEGLDSEDFA